MNKRILNPYFVLVLSFCLWVSRALAVSKEVVDAYNEGFETSFRVDQKIVQEAKKLVQGMTL